MKVIDPYIVIEQMPDLFNNKSQFDGILIKIIHNKAVFTDFINYFNNICTIANTDDDYYQLNYLTFIRNQNIIDNDIYEIWYNNIKNIDYTFNEIKKINNNLTRSDFENNFLTNNIKTEFTIIVNKYTLNQLFIKTADIYRDLNEETIIIILSILDKFNRIFNNIFKEANSLLKYQYEKIKEKNINLISII